MCQACKAITELILAGATSAGIVADLVIKDAGAADRKPTSAQPARGDQHDPTHDRLAH